MKVYHMRRKLIIGLSAFGIVVLLFLVYAMFMDTTSIKVPKSSEVQDMPMPQPQLQREVQEETTDIKGAQDAKYYKYDKETKKLQAVYGFKTMADSESGTSRRKVEKPYLLFYNKK